MRNIAFSSEGSKDSTVAVQLQEEQDNHSQTKLKLEEIQVSFIIIL
jgi:hypothetical protein